MKAIQIKEFGSADMLEITERPTPEAGKDEVLIKITAAGLNRADIVQRKGHYPPPEGVTDIPGLEVSGIVEKSNSDKWKESDKVCALLAGGGYAEYCTVHADLCLPVPEHVDLTEAAGLPEAIFTVWNNIFDLGEFKSGDKVLIHGGSSGIGTMGIQMVKAIGGTIFTTAGTFEKCDACKSLGADHVINYKKEDYAEKITEITDGAGVDIVLDMVGGDYILKDMGIMAANARHINIAFLDDRYGKIDIALMMRKRLRLMGSTLRAQPVTEKARLAADISEQIWEHVESGTIKPVIYKSFALEDAHKAHECMEDGGHIGKILLTL